MHTVMSIDKTHTTFYIVASYDKIPSLRHTAEQTQLTVTLGAVHVYPLHQVTELSTGTL